MSWVDDEGEKSFCEKANWPLEDVTTCDRNKDKISSKMLTPMQIIQGSYAERGKDRDR